MKRVFALVLALVIIASLSCVPAMAQSAYPDCDHVGDVVSASEDGYVNITFSNGYNGFCICYGDEDADKEDGFTISNMSLAVNRINGENVSQHLKRLFVDQFDAFFTYSATEGLQIKDPFVLQCTIWHFSDNNNSWRVDANLVADVKSAVASATQTIPDHGYTKKINDTTLAIFDFHVMQAHKGDGYQNFWTYKISFAPYPAPVVTSPTQDQIVTVIAGQTATLSVTATNAESYQWQVDTGDGFKNIEGATGASYTTPAITKENEGHKYRCVVTNTAGSDISPVYSLDAVEKPVFTTPTADQQISVYEGKTAQLTAEATDAYAYQWQMDSGEGFGDIDGATQKTYTIPVISDQNSGYKYRCVASNIAGSTESHVFSLKKIPAPEITDPTQDQIVTVIAGQTATLSVTATNAESYQWQVDTGDGFKNIEGATGASYTTPAITKENEGHKYRCVVTNTAGSDISPVYSLDAVEKPVFTTPTADQQISVYEGKTAQLTAEATDAYAYQWQMDSGEGFGDIDGATQKTYTIPVISDQNSGYKYRCVASNIAGSTESHVFSLKKIPAPEITDPTADKGIDAYDGKSVGLTVTATNAESYQWQVDTGDGFKDIEGATESSYTIPAITQSNSSYKYRCVASNPVGSDASPVFTLHVVNVDPPIVTGNDKTITVKKDGQATLTVTAEDGETYQWQVKTEDGFKDIEGATAASYTVPASNTEGSTQYRCVVSNDNGESVSPVYTVIVTEPSATPETGDPFHPVLLSCVMLLSFAAAAWICKKHV